MDLKLLSDKDLHLNTTALAQRDREITLQVLHHLREVERRSLYATLAYPSLFEYVVKELKYSEGAAQRRISSMRLLKELPELEKKIESGRLSLSSLSQAQVFFRQEKAQIQNNADKREVLACIENKSSREVERELVSRATCPETLYKEKVRAVSNAHTELKFLVDAKVLKEIEELKNLLAHTYPHATLKDLMGYAITTAIEKLRPKAPRVKVAAATKAIAAEIAGGEMSNQTLPPAPAVKKPARYIPAQVKREVWRRDGGQCTFRNLATAKDCCARHGLEYDHIIPFAVGGETSVQNLRLRCRAHNQLAAVQSFGGQKMAAHLARLRQV